MSGFKKAVNPLGPGRAERWAAMRLPKRTLYVSDLGRVRTLKWDYTRERVFGGYRKVGFQAIYRLVAEAFVPRVPGLDVVNHRDAVKTHDIVSNLEWTTRKGNAEHAQRLGLYAPTTGANHWTAERARRKTGEKNGRAVLTAAAVLAIRSSPRSLGQLAATYGVTKTTISAVKNRKNWRHL